MKTPVLRLLGCLAAGLAGTAVRGQPTPAPAGPAEPAAANPAPPISPVEHPAALTPEPARPRRSREVSSDVARSISAGMPKFRPPTPTPAVPDEEKPDLRDVDKPRNGIIRLPTYVLRADRSPVLSERDVSTGSGLAALAIKRYLSDLDRGLNSFTIPLFGTSLENRALTAYGERERLQHMADLRDDAATAGLNDAKESAYIRRESQDTFMRRADFGYQGPTR